MSSGDALISNAEIDNLTRRAQGDRAKDLAGLGDELFSDPRPGGAAVTFAQLRLGGAAAESETSSDTDSVAGGEEDRLLCDGGSGG